MRATSRHSSRRRRVLAGLALSVSGLGLAVAIAQAEPPAHSAAAGARCHSSQLRVKLGPAGAALGHIGQLVSFENASATRCTLYGYPGLQMLAANGRPIHTQVLRGVAYTVPSVPERLVSLAPDHEASFDLGYDDGTGYGNESCPTSARVEVTPPNAYTPITVVWRMQPYGGGTIQHLRCGQITVSPVFAAPVSRAGCTVNPGCSTYAANPPVSVAPRRSARAAAAAVAPHRPPPAPRRPASRGSAAGSRR